LIAGDKVPERANIEKLPGATKGKAVPLRSTKKPVVSRGPLLAVPLTQVQITDEFWKPRLETNRRVTIPFSFDKCQGKRIGNFARVSYSAEGEFEGNFYDDSDLYKVIEGAAYCLHGDADPDLEQYVDNVIDTIASAQWEDGYLYTFYSLPRRQPEKRWTDIQNKHELYCAGHLIEAATAYYGIAGKRKFLDVAIKLADHICSVFGPNKKHDVPGHQEIELALVKLYKLTGSEKYLKLAKFFLDERGQGHKRDTYGIYSQDHKPVIRQSEAVGHVVRAIYMYCGMADVASVTNDYEYVEALDRLWEDVVSTKMYITGGAGARSENESFGDKYELPNKTAYGETCASIAMAMWNHRLFLLHKDAKYIDVFERVLYNSLISGVSMKGDRFFYPNVLESDGQFKFNKGSATRQPWFDCSCCPTNIARFLPSVPGFVYAQENNVLYVNLFVAGSTSVKIDGQRTVQLRQETNYPWDGQISLAIDTDRPTRFTIKIRIPGWSRNNPVPSNLYRYMNHSDERITLKVNGQEVDPRLERGFAVLDQTWNVGDSIELNLPMSIRRVLCHEQVEGNRAKTALERGPIVYCAEAHDNGGKALDIVLPDDVALDSEHHRDMLGGITIIKGCLNKNKPFIAIPYYAWSHRGEGEMAVWLSRQTAS